MFYLLSTLVLGLIVLGLWQRRNRKRHITLMLSAFALDLALVLAIELERHAVETVIAPQADSFTLFHAGISLMVLLLYVALAIQGYGIIRGRPQARRWHRQFAGAFIAFRLANYITSFFM